MTAEDTAEPTLAITEQAIEKVRGFRAQSEDPENQAMWVEVTGVSGGEYVYDISLKALDAARQGDAKAAPRRPGDRGAGVERREAARRHHRLVATPRAERLDRRVARTDLVRGSARAFRRGSRR